MGTSQADKEKHHERIVAIAARMVREKGLDGVAIADLMKDAGLTHGGFYRHFDSREDLISEAVECALGQWMTKRAAGSNPNPPRKRFQAFVDEYLSITHRNAPGNGCAVAALSGEAWRGGKRMRQAYTRQVKLYLALMEGVLVGRRSTVRRDAMLALSAVIGAVAMARSVDDEQLSRDILSFTGEALKHLLARD